VLLIGFDLMKNSINSSCIDMHIHTHFSDGTFSPKQAVEYAAKMKLSAISITDHDCVDGINEALDCGFLNNVEVVPGIELSSQYKSKAGEIEVHILGYYIDYKSEYLKEYLDAFKKTRYNTAVKIFDKFMEYGIELKNTDFISNSKNRAVGRMHFAKALVKENFAGSIQEAFQRYLSKGRPCYVPKSLMSVKDAVKLVLNCGGIPVIAHPYHIYYADINLFRSLIKCGFMGIEAWHIKHSASIAKTFIDIAEKSNLLVTGGSDCHGPCGKEKPVMGEVKVPYSVLVKLKGARK
jgi:predicted metal-dependent phosphoesterase TrpH